MPQSAPSQSIKKLPDILSWPDLKIVYPDAMAVILQHREEERAIRKRQLDSGATRLTHIRPARAKASEAGSLARFRSGYRKNSFFGPFCEIISSRLISNLSELSAEETKYLAPEFKSVERLRSRDWARASKIEVLVLQTIPEDKP